VKKEDPICPKHKSLVANLSVAGCNSYRIIKKPTNKRFLEATDLPRYDDQLYARITVLEGWQKSPRGGDFCLLGGRNSPCEGEFLSLGGVMTPPVRGGHPLLGV